MDGPGEKPLARAAGSLDQNMAVTLGDVRQDLEDLLHPLILADHVAAAVTSGDGLAKRFQHRQVSEDLHSPDHIAPVVADQRRGHADGDFLSCPVDNGGGMIVDRFARLQGPFQRTVGLAGTGTEDVEAELVHGLCEGESCNLFGGAVEERIDPALKIHGEDAVRHALQDGAAGETVVSVPACCTSRSWLLILLAVFSGHRYTPSGATP
jgi:hypothetical protein